MRAGTLLASLAFLIASALSPSFSYAKSELYKASYWIDRLVSPDEVVLGPVEIRELNRATVESTDQMAVVEDMPDAVSGEKLSGWVLYDPLPTDADGRRYSSRGKRLKRAFFDRINENMNIPAIGDENEVRFGVVLERADIRAFPTDDKVLRKPGSREFDTFQYSSVYPPEKVALLHRSADGKWGFFQTGNVRGWIRLDKVALGEREEVFRKSGEEFLVVTGSKVKVYSDGRFRKLLGTVPMGAVFYFSDEDNGAANAISIKFPERSGEGLKWREAYLKKDSDVSRGFLPYTRRNAITQAFKMLGEEYGWGGQDGKRDCSEFIKDLFATMGITLPRNSRQQGFAGNILAHSERYAKEEIGSALKNAEPGLTLLGMSRHVMLYIGDRNGEPFVIHQVFGYADGRRFKVLNRVAVTGLDIGGKSKAGPFKNRIKSVNEIIIPNGAAQEGA